MSSQKCVVEGCTLEYDVICSFSFYNVNVGSDGDNLRQTWIEGAMKDESEGMWRHVSLQLCGYHFEMDSQGLWIDSPMLPELLTLHKQKSPFIQTENDKKRCGAKGSKDSYQGLFERFIGGQPKVAEIIRMEHNYSFEPASTEEPSPTRLNVRQLVDTLGYLSLKNLQRKQLWVVKVETDNGEGSVTQTEQVITKMQNPKQIIEIVPQSSLTQQSTQIDPAQTNPDNSIPDNFIYEIAEEQEIGMDEVKEIPIQNNEWMVNIIPEEPKPKYAYIKHCASGKKKRHFTTEVNEISLQGDFENYYILPDADPSVGVEVTTSYEPESYIVQEYDHLVLHERPRKRSRDSKDSDRKKKKGSTSSSNVKQIDIKTEVDDWVIDSNIGYDQDNSDDYDKGNNSRVRRKNKKYLGYDFIT